MEKSNTSTKKEVENSIVKKPVKVTYELSKSGVLSYLESVGKEISRLENSTKKAKIEIACRLLTADSVIKKAKDSKLVEYSGIGEYADLHFGLSKVQASQYISVARLFCEHYIEEKDGVEKEVFALKPEIEDRAFGFTQLVELSTALSGVKNEDELKRILKDMETGILSGEINAGQSCKLIREKAAKLKKGTLFIEEKTSEEKANGGKTDGGKTDGEKANGGKTDGGKTDGEKLKTTSENPFQETEKERVLRMEIETLRANISAIVSEMQTLKPSANNAFKNAFTGVIAKLDMLCK